MPDATPTRTVLTEPQIAELIEECCRPIRGPMTYTMMHIIARRAEAATLAASTPADPQADAADAARYRWLRSVPSGWEAKRIVNDSPEGMDAAIDSAMSKPNPHLRRIPSRPEFATGAFTEAPVSAPTEPAKGDAL